MNSISTLDAARRKRWREVKKARRAGKKWSEAQHKKFAETMAKKFGKHKKE